MQGVRRRHLQLSGPNSPLPSSSMDLSLRHSSAMAIFVLALSSFGAARAADLAPLPAPTSPSVAPAQPVAAALPRTCEPGWEERVAFAMLPSVVRVENVAQPVLAIGAGFVVFDKRHVVTAYHVVRNLDEAINVRFRSGATRNARVVSHNSKKDVALLELNEDAPADANPIAIATRDPYLAEGVLALGHPLGIYADRPEDFDSDFDGRGLLNWSVSRGIVSAFNADLVQTDAPSVTHGMSGGPLLTCDGTVIGLASGAISEAAAAAHLMMYVRNAHWLALKDARDTVPMRHSRMIPLTAALAVPVHFRTDETFWGAALALGFGLPNDVARFRGTIGFLTSSNEPVRPTELLVGARQRFFWSIDTSIAPRIFGERSSFRPAAVVGLSSMTDTATVRSFRGASGGPCTDGTSACGSIERSDLDAFSRAYRPFVGGELRMGAVEVGYAYHFDSRSMQRSVHALTFAVNFGRLKN